MGVVGSSTICQGNWKESHLSVHEANQSSSTLFKGKKKVVSALLSSLSKTAVEMAPSMGRVLMWFLSTESPLTSLWESHTQGSPYWVHNLPPTSVLLVVLDLYLPPSLLGLLVWAYTGSYPGSSNRQEVDSENWPSAIGKDVCKLDLWCHLLENQRE